MYITMTQGSSFLATLGSWTQPRWDWRTTTQFAILAAVPQSLSAVYIHLVFCAKDRRPFLRDKPTRDALHSYLGGVSKQLNCPPILVVGVEEHVHRSRASDAPSRRPNG